MCCMDALDLKKMAMWLGKANVERAIEKYAKHAPGYDRSAQRTMHLRKLTIDRLSLMPGDVVLDVACGTGLSFDFLQERIGPSGTIIGVEASPDMVRLARKRIEEKGWKNVILVEDSMETAVIEIPFSAVLFNYTHDVIRSEAALFNIFKSAQPSARVAVAGMKLLPWWLAAGNLYVLYSASPYMTTFEGLGKPWTLLECFVQNFRYEPTLFGSGYIGWGAYRG